MANKGLDDLNEKFQGWNPMEDDFRDNKFNLYDSGPGASLDKALQPAELAKQENGSSLNPYLVFKRLPRGMTEKSIKNLCERYANVMEVSTSASKFVFVKFYNIADMESVHRALNNTDYGFKVENGRHFSTSRKNVPFEEWQERSIGILDRPPPPTGVDLENRRIRPAENNPPRPKLENTANHEIDDEKCAIPKNDPLHHVLKNHDAHDLERCGVRVPKVEAKNPDDFVYHTGRAFRTMTPEYKKQLEESHKKSKGTYDAKKDRYCNQTKSGKEKFSPIHKCVVCQQRSNLSCYRCNPKLFVYCSRQCQYADWEDHRKICGQKKNIATSSTPRKERLSCSSDSSGEIAIASKKNLTEKEEVQKSTSFSSSSSHNDSFSMPSIPKPNSVVVMTAVNNTNLVFIRSNSREDNANYFETITKVQMAGKKLDLLKKLPKVGQAVIAKFQESNEYGRALVLSVTDKDNIKINFLDYGNTEKQTVSNLYRLPREFLAMDRFAVPILLKDVPNYYMTNEVRTFMYSYLKDKELVVKYDAEQDLIPITNVYQADLYDASTNQHLNKIISALCKPQEPKNIEELMTAHDLELMPLPHGKDLEYFIMDNTQLHVGCLSCTTKEFALEIEKFSGDIQLYAESLEPMNYAPREDELCIAKYSLDGLWYRGRCLEKAGDGEPSILFIDYGNIALVKVADIRPYPQKFQWPIYTEPFAIAGLPENVDKKIVARLEELLPCGYRLRCDFVEKIENDFYSASVDGLIRKLKAEKLIE